MSRIVRCSLIQTISIAHEGKSLAEIKQAMIDKHVPLIRQAAAAGSQIVCLQEIFYGPYFCAEQTIRWYDSTEQIPNGPTTKLMQDLARIDDRLGQFSRFRGSQQGRVLGAHGQRAGRIDRGDAVALPRER